MEETLLVKPAEETGIVRVAVVFSSLNANGFSFYNMFEKHAANLHRIYVRDPNDMWYDRGISEELPDWSALSRRIAAEIEALGATDVVTFGASMGAYAGIRLARELDASCIALSPQTLLDLRLPHTPKQPVSDASRDLGALLGSWQPRNAAVIFGAADFVDIYNVLRIDWQGAELVPIAEQDHLVSQFLLSRKVMTALIRDFAASGFFSATRKLHERGIDIDKNCFDAVQRQLIFRIVEGYYLSAPWDVTGSLRALRALRDWADGYRIEASLLSRAGQHKEAAELARTASRLAPRSVTISDAGAEILARADDIPGAIKGYRNSLRLRTKHYAALCRLGELLARTGQTDEARQMLAEAVGVRPRLTRAQTIAERNGLDLASVPQA